MYSINITLIVSDPLIEVNGEEIDVRALKSVVLDNRGQILEYRLDIGTALRVVRNVRSDHADDTIESILRDAIDRVDRIRPPT